jgi:nitrogen-specific signal transduction histidine kinase
MFGFRRIRLDPGAHVLGVWCALILMAAAFLVNTASIYLVIRDHDLLGRWLARPVAAPASLIDTLQTEFDLRIASRLIVSAILIFGAMAILGIQRTLRHDRLVAANVFARMEKGVLIVDRWGIVTAINAAAARILRLEGDKRGTPLATISSPDLPLTEMVTQLDQRNPPRTERDCVVEQNGRSRRISVDAQVVESAAGDVRHSILMLTDTTQRYLDEQRLQRIERFHNLGWLASGLIHEIGNPLTALDIHVQLLEERLSEPGSMARASAGELMDVLKSEIQRLKGVLEEFRDYADLQTLSFLPTDLSAVLERIVRLIRPQAARQSVRVELEQPDRPLPMLSLDAEKCVQAVLNLAINALEAMPGGGELVLATELRESAVVVSISDTGPGIAPEVRENLFKPYVTTKQRGTGLGLALTEKLVLQHQGQITYRTGPHGTTFRLTFPMSPLPIGDLAPCPATVNSAS